MLPDRAKLLYNTAMLIRTTVFLCWLAAPLAALAAPLTQNWDFVRQEAQAFVAQGWGDQPHVFRWEAYTPPALPACERGFDIRQDAKTQGHTAVHVRCKGPQSWQVRLPVWISALALRPFSRQDLARNQTLTDTDIEWKSVEVAQYPEDALTQPQALLGQVTRQSIPAGQVLRSSFLRPPWAVENGQTVRVRLIQPGFEISSEGRALGNAADGLMVNVRMPSGKVIMGIAHTGGIVEVSP